MIIITARKKPIEIEAVIYDGSKKCATEILHWMFPDIGDDATASDLTISTLEGDLKASVGDYIIKGIKGEFYPCKPEVFTKSYDVLTEIQYPLVNCGYCHGSGEDENRIGDFIEEVRSGKIKQKDLNF